MYMYCMQLESCHSFTNIQKEVFLKQILINTMNLPTHLLPVYSSLLGVYSNSQRGSVLKSMAFLVAMLIRCFLTSWGEKSGYLSNTWTAAPATTPQASDVPVVVLYREQQQDKSWYWQCSLCIQVYIKIMKHNVWVHDADFICNSYTVPYMYLSWSVAAVTSCPGANSVTQLP